MVRYTFNARKEPYTTDVVIACHYAGRASKRRPKKKKKGIRYYAYAVYGVGKRSVQAISAAYHHRFAIESGYRQLHQVRARTRSPHTGLRLLLIGLALILVNLYVLVRARWAIVTRYGSRIYRRAVTLNEVATALLVQIQSLLGFSPEFYCRARGPGNQFIS
jgi:IS4 transposase